MRETLCFPQKRSSRALGLTPLAKAEMLVLRAPRSDHAYLKLVRFDDAGRKMPTRPGARAWDTGCIWSIMVRAKGTAAIYDDAIAMGWWTQTPITPLAFNGSNLNVVVFQGPDGVQVQPYERVGQPLPKHFPDFERSSQPFNIMQTVGGHEAVRVLIEVVFGFQRFWLGAPYTEKEPKPMETGRLEVIEIIGLEGYDHGEACRAPSPGTLGVT